MNKANTQSRLSDYHRLHGVSPHAAADAAPGTSTAAVVSAACEG